MKSKTTTYIIVVFLITIILLVIVELSSRSIPELSVSVNGESLQVVKAGYRWKSLLRVVCVESENPKVLVEDIEPFKVQKGQLLSLKFSGIPDKIDMYNFTNNERLETTGILGAYTPDEVGIHVIQVVSYWKSGTISYVFNIEVSN